MRAPLLLAFLFACNKAPIADDSDGDADEDAIDAPTWHLDADGDTFGGPRTEVACQAPSGFVESSNDCDDVSFAAHPGGTEVCGGGDEDCDSLVDDEDPDVGQ